MTSKLPSIEKEKNGRITCTVSFDEAKIAPAEAKALQNLGRKVQIPGFRPGKIPMEKLREKISEGDLLEETVRELLPQTVEALIKEHDIKPIAQPKVELTEKKPLTLKLIFVEHPTVKLKGVEKIKIPKNAPKVEDKEIDRVIASVLSKHETAAEVNRPAQKSDRLTIDFWAKDKEGKEITPIRTQGHKVVIGSKTLIPGFEDALLGTKKGEEKEFTLTFPEKYHAEELQNKPVTFTATVQKIEEVKLPDLTDDFAKEHLQVPSVETFKKEVRTAMEGQEERIEKQRRETALLDAIRTATVVDLAPELVQEEMQSLLSDISEDLQRQGKTIEDWLKATKKKPEEVEKELMEQASKRLTLRLGIRELMTVKQIDVSDEEMGKAVAELLLTVPEKELANVAPAYKKGERAWDQLKWQKKVEKLFEMMLAA
ncbi:MAG: trigger factor [Candidatus Peregrinibacteria bacterium]